MQQIVSLDVAIRALKLPYLYELTQSDLQKRKKRQEIGMMLAGILEDMREELLQCVIAKYAI
jgi:hypothetical protein